MKKKKFKGMFLTLLALASVFLFSSGSVVSTPTPLSANAQQEVVNPIQTFQASFGGFSGKYYRNYETDVEAFPGIKCVGYRYSKPNGGSALKIHTQEYTGRYFLQVEPLPGMLANTTAIKGITNITMKYYGDGGQISYDNRVDFRTKTTKTLDVSAGHEDLVLNFNDAYHPCYFRIESTVRELTIVSLKITRNYNLGIVHNTLCPSGYEQDWLTRHKITPNSTTMPINIDTSPQYYGKITATKTYNPDTKYDNLTDAINQIALFGNRAQTLNVQHPEGYARNDGYVRAFGDAYIQNQTYYEFDVPLGGSKGRGVGRIVYFTKGVNSKGYENQPLIVYTDDHYLTFKEFLNYSLDNKAVFGPRFNAQSLLTGYKWTPTRSYNDLSTTGPKPEDLPRTVKLTPEDKIRLDIGESFQYSVDALNIMGIQGDVKYNESHYPLDKSKDPVYTLDKKTHTITAVKYGSGYFSATVFHDPVGIYPYVKKQTSNTLDIIVCHFTNMNVTGDCKKTYYEGEVFDPTGLSVVTDYQTSKTMHANIDNNDCKWLNPSTRDIYMTKGQTSVLCVYKHLEVEIKGINVLDSPKITSMEISEPEGEIIVDKEIQLSVNMQPENACKFVNWTLHCEDGAAKITKDGLLTPLKANQYIEVTATSLVSDFKTTSYYKIVDQLTYKFTPGDSWRGQLANGEYILACSSKDNFYEDSSGEIVNYAYDPTINSTQNTRIIDQSPNGDISNPLIGCKIRITQVPGKDYYYYMQRTDNNLYLDFSSNDLTINENSRVPVENYIRMYNEKCYIYSADNTKIFRFNENWMTFGKYQNDDTIESNLTLYGKEVANERYGSIDGFVGLYMHLDDYKENLGWCNDDGHHYYRTAKEAYLRLNNDERLLLSKSTVYKTVWARLNEWARNNNEQIVIDAQGNVTFNVLNSNLISIKQDSNLTIILCVTLLSSFSFIAFLIIKRKQIRQ